MKLTIDTIFCVGELVSDAGIAAEERSYDSRIERVRFNYSTETWESGSYDLPWHNEDYVLLTPKDLLTKDDTWISRVGMFHNFSTVLHSVDNEQLREQMNNYFLYSSEDDQSSAISSQTSIGQCLKSSLWMN